MSCEGAVENILDSVENGNYYRKLEPLVDDLLVDEKDDIDFKHAISIILEEQS